MSQTAVITGAGSGIGRGVALRLAQEGWRTVLAGRRKAALEGTRRLIDAAGATPPFLYPCDLRVPEAVREMAKAVLAEVGSVEVLVNAAGINVPRRAWRDCSQADYRQVVETNLTGAFLCCQAFLPGMRRRRSGTIVNIVSDAARQASAKAGAAYVASKFGLLGLTQSLNAEERANGLRACAILPGDVNTPLLDRRPAPPPASARRKMLQPEDVAACVLLAVGLPRRAVVEELLIRPG